MRSTRTLCVALFFAIQLLFPGGKDTNIKLKLSNKVADTKREVKEKIPASPSEKGTERGQA